MWTEDIFRSVKNPLPLSWALADSATPLSPLAGTFFAHLLLDVVPSWRHRVFGNLVSRMPLVVLQRPDQRRPQDVQVLKRKKGQLWRALFASLFWAQSSVRWLNCMIESQATSGTCAANLRLTEGHFNFNVWVKSPIIVMSPTIENAVH